MNLRNGQITVGELLSNPAVRRLAQQEFPGIMNHPMLHSAYNMSISQVMTMARGRVPQVKINRLLQTLESL
ncbi:hypothetical protein [Marasmitruncus massiliensis]|jgi:hypothetical protein|uniref:hypothetical protein n=1 Tax=Marasmitruncus massiliensis TaxID=1944642 RepID=UPI000C7B987C|nr:hypothetical protein [Marasmitruncus massiliensis]MBE6907421.1 hypothetical protein [Oscillospiraceae bacterium]